MRLVPSRGGFQRVAGYAGVPAPLKGGVVAIGNFDGVHRGHQALLERALEEARRLETSAVVFTFEPHPRTFFKPETPLFRITDAAMRARLIRQMGFDAVVEQGFSAAFAALTAEDFVARVLVAGLGAAHLVTGHDFHYGKDRGGTPATLSAAAEDHGFGVSRVEPFRDEGGEVVSSSRIRARLAEGDVAGAAGLLGYRYTVEAEVVRGRRLGRTLGYPTANMVLPEENGLAHGIYAVRLRRADGGVHDGVASFGRRPTVESDGAALLETFVFDFDDDLYGETCAVSFFARLRGEERFDGLEALVERMRADEAEARAVLAGVAPLGALDARLCF